MAKQRSLPPFPSEMSVRESAQIVIAVRIKEIMSHVPAALNPEKKQCIHDMRISFKRLRYCLEFMKSWLNPQYPDILREFKKYQDVLGEIHDCDILIDILKAELKNHFKGERNFWRQLQDKNIAKVSLHELEYQLHEYSKGDPKLGLTDWLFRTLKTRNQLFEEFIERWHIAHKSNFWDRVLALALDPNKEKLTKLSSVKAQNANIVEIPDSNELDLSPEVDTTAGQIEKTDEQNEY